jgi:CheY-like chemotaxis protein
MMTHPAVWPARTNLRHPGSWMARHWVLVVDDDQAACDLLVTSLRVAPGFMATGAGGGVDALEMCAVMLPDAVLVNLAVPETDASELVRRLRGMPGLAGVVVVAMTATDAVGRQRALDAGCDAVLAQPVDLERLLATLRRSLRVSRGTHREVLACASW